MPKLLKPTSMSRYQIHFAIQQYATGQLSRQQMMTQIAGVLDRHGVTRLTINGNYLVRKVAPVEFDFPHPVVLIEAKDRIYKRCPACGSRDDRYLAGESPVIKTWCMSCGSIYRKQVSWELFEREGDSYG